MDNSSGSAARPAVLGHQLIETHHRLLEALDRLRDGGDPPRDLRTQCREERRLVALLDGLDSDELRPQW